MPSIGDIRNSLTGMVGDSLVIGGVKVIVAVESPISAVTLGEFVGKGSGAKLGDPLFTAEDSVDVETESGLSSLC